LDYPNPKQPQNGIPKPFHYEFNLKKKWPFKNRLIATACSENDMDIVKSKDKFKLVTIKVND
jgi:hypothetical protein